MATELGLSLRDPNGRMSAPQVLEDLRQMLRLVDEIEVAHLGRGSRTRERSTWAFSRLAVGSVEAALTPVEPRGGATWADLEQVATRVIGGYAEAERREVLPDGWTLEAAKPARELARDLGTDAGLGMRLRLFIDGRLVREAEVTKDAARHLEATIKHHRDATTKRPRQSLGSVVGTLGSINVKGKRLAGLWPDRGGPRVRLLFTDDQMPALRDALGARVQVSGLIRRDADGRIIGVTVRRLERLPSRGEGKPLTGLVGLVPTLTGNLSTLAYLDEIRGTS